ncbi:MAG: Asp-tRNA(Asn)/Glu-tRNA(Gln) amidotransferase subunit GatC [Firmicutes bacterium]|nr:Asp-tRNA(Asn)/Glu-tRNA(Gln) amidotransferase subunit GatC [Bacillota bacterium]
MRLSKEDIKRISDLARIELNEEDESLFAEQMSGILRIVNKLDKVDTSGMDQMVTPTGFTNVLREDIALPSLDPKEALFNAADREGAFFKVPRIIEVD